MPLRPIFCVRAILLKTPEAGTTPAKEQLVALNLTRSARLRTFGSCGRKLRPLICRFGGLSHFGQKLNVGVIVAPATGSEQLDKVGASPFREVAPFARCRVHGVREPWGGHRNSAGRRIGDTLIVACKPDSGNGTTPEAQAKPKQFTGFFEQLTGRTTRADGRDGL
jgi:hypothetical protein